MASSQDELETIERGVDDRVGSEGATAAGGGGGGKRKPPVPLDQMRAYRACLNCRNRKSRCDLDINQGRPVSGSCLFTCLFCYFWVLERRRKSVRSASGIRFTFRLLNWKSGNLFSDEVSLDSQSFISMFGAPRDIELEVSKGTSSKSPLDSQHRICSINMRRS